MLGVRTAKAPKKMRFLAKETATTEALAFPDDYSILEESVADGEANDKFLVKNEPNSCHGAWADHSRTKWVCSPAYINFLKVTRHQFCGDLLKEDWTRRKSRVSTYIILMSKNVQITK